eukprot:UN18385
MVCVKNFLTIFENVHQNYMFFLNLIIIVGQSLFPQPNISHEIILYLNLLKCLISGLNCPIRAHEP